LDQGKWAAAFPLVRDMLSRSANDFEVEKRLRWLLVVGELAQKDGNNAEAARAALEAQPFLDRAPGLAPGFKRLQ
jgi:hypothetical protein